MTIYNITNYIKFPTVSETHNFPGMVHNPAYAETGKALSPFSPRDVGIRTGLAEVFAGQHIRNILDQCTMQAIREEPDTRPTALLEPWSSPQPV